MPCDSLYNETHLYKRSKQKPFNSLPNISQRRVLTNPERLRIRSDRIKTATWMKFGTSYRLHILQSGNRYKFRSILIGSRTVNL